jgi:gliding motility-associated peptidyl-prolyl isomerase
MAACEGPEPRKPVEVRSGSFMKASVSRNKELLAAEEAEIMRLMEADTLHKYHSSASGTWYYYIRENQAASLKPVAGDLVTMTYDLRTLSNDTIYSMDEIGVKSYLVDKEELFPGLRNSVKLLKEGESATFFFPSSLGFGYHGDNRKIGPNVPLVATINLLAIEQQTDSIQK